MIIGQDYANAPTDVPTQMLIAPVLPTMVSDRAYAVGEQFIVNSVLYEITQAVSAADVPLVVGTNCKVSDSITQQMEEFKYDSGWQDITVTGSSTKASIRRVGNFVTFIFNGTISGLTPNTENPVATIPAGFGPSKLVFADYKSQAVYISPSAFVVSPSVTTPWISVTITYPLG